jgi:DNA-binding transcriptional MerR regulator
MSMSATATLDSSWYGDGDGSVSSVEVCQLVGITYRQLDHWLRVGSIDLPDPNPGSGMRRRFAIADVARLQRVVEKWREAQIVMEDFRTGKLWKETV